MKQTIIPSPQTQQEAQAIAKASQKPGQTKEQTKLIAQGIERGIALYKKQQKEKSRQADRAKKKVSAIKKHSREYDERSHDTPCQTQRKIKAMVTMGTVNHQLDGVYCLSLNKSQLIKKASVGWLKHETQGLLQ